MSGVTLGVGNTASKAIVITSGAVTLDFLLNCSAGPSIVTFFLEFSEDGKTWFAEVADEDSGNGVVLMPKVVRTFADNNGVSIADNAAFAVCCQFTRRAPIVRVQMAASAGTVVVTSLTAPFGSLAV
jgi:hypothetical protein